MAVVRVNPNVIGDWVANSIFDAIYNNFDEFYTGILKGNTSNLSDRTIGYSAPIVVKDMQMSNPIRSSGNNIIGLRSGTTGTKAFVDVYPSTTSGGKVAIGAGDGSAWGDVEFYGVAGTSYPSMVIAAVSSKFILKFPALSDGLMKSAGSGLYFCGGPNGISTDGGIEANASGVSAPAVRIRVRGTTGQGFTVTEENGTTLLLSKDPNGDFFSYVLGNQYFESSPNNDRHVFGFPTAAQIKFTHGDDDAVVTLKNETGTNATITHVDVKHRLDVAALNGMRLPTRSGDASGTNLEAGTVYWNTSAPTGKEFRIYDGTNVKYIPYATP